MQGVSDLIDRFFFFILQRAVGVECVLFEEETDPIVLIKHKELIEILEMATDKAEDVANVLETIVLKSA